MLQRPHGQIGVSLGDVHDRVTCAESNAFLNLPAPGRPAWQCDAQVSAGMTARSPPSCLDRIQSCVSKLLRQIWRIWPFMCPPQAIHSRQPSAPVEEGTEAPTCVADCQGARRRCAVRHIGLKPRREWSHTSRSRVYYRAPAAWEGWAVLFGRPSDRLPNCITFARPGD